jgi:hypothetical protein
MYHCSLQQQQQQQQEGGGDGGSSSVSIRWQNCTIAAA